MRIFPGLLSAALLLSTSTAYALGPTATVEGISNDVDLHERDPVMVFGKAVFPDASRILVDATERNNLYASYPIRFDFYINGNLVLSQFRSKELPIPVGITLSKADYPLPYNFTLVATVVTPNLVFTTTAYGVMNNSDFAVSLPCTLTLANASGGTTDYKADSVTLGNTANGGLTFTFTGTSGSQSEDISANLTVTGSSAVSGTLTLNQTGASQSSTVNVTGTVTLTDGNLTTLSAASSDATTKLSCG